MAAYFNTRVQDNGLSTLDSEADKLYICSQQPTTYAQATSTYALGNKAGISVSAPDDRAAGGREVTVSAITDGTVTATGEATHYALVDSANSRLLVAQALSASQSVTSGNVFTLPAFKVGIPGGA